MTPKRQLSYPTQYLDTQWRHVPIPPVRKLTEPHPDFTHEDVAWVSDAISVARAEVDRYRSAVSKGANPVFAARLAPAEAALVEGEARFGPDGSGLAGALNSGAVWGDFWHAMFCIFGLRAQRPTRIEGEIQDRIICILRKLPLSLRQMLLAQAFFPSMRKPRKWEGCQAMVIEALKRPDTDLRLWEVGADKIASPEAMADDTLIEIARSFGAKSGQYAAFVAHAHDVDPAKSPLRTDPTSAPGTIPADRAEALAVLEDFPVAKTYGSGGQVKSEMNLQLTQAFHATMRKIRPGIPAGHLMHLALSTIPAGPTWPRVDFKEFPLGAVWPYVATHLDIVSRALDDKRLPWEPMMEPLKALNALAFLPELPASVAPQVERLAKTGTVAQKRAAKALL